MKVVLKQHVPDLGRRGEVVEVAAGYARNYLLPQGFALGASQGNVQAIESERKSYLVREAKQIEEAQEIKQAIEKLQLTLKMQASEDGKLFGSVSERIIVEALEEEKIKIERQMVRLESPIREVGRYTLRIHLHPEVDAELGIWVVEEKSE